MDETKHDHVVMVAEDDALIGMMLADDLQDAGYTVAGPFSHVAAALAWLECFSPRYRQASGEIPAGRIIAVRRVR